MAQLRYIDDNGQLQVRSLDAEPCIIGRAPNCQIILVDDTISREHVRIELDTGGRYRVRDLGSRNKTYVNGELISDTFLTPGDMVRAGARVLEFLDEGAAAPALDGEYLSTDREEPPDCEWVKTKSPVSLAIGQIERLAGLLHEQRVTARPEDIAAAALSQVLLDLQAERGIIALKGNNKLELRPLAHRSLKKPAGTAPMPINQPFILAPILQGVAGRYPRAAGELNPKSGYAVTAVVAPLTFRGEVMGVLYADRAQARKPFSGPELQFAVAAGALLGATITESTRNIARSASREGAAWITALRRVHSALVTPIASNESFTLATKTFPGRVRCGDFVDVIHVDEFRSGALVVDGGGHGMTGLAQASAMRYAVRAAIAASEDTLSDPSVLFQSLNTAIAESRARQVIPCTFLGIDLSVGRINYINAGGMAPVLLVAPGRLVTLDRVALVLGADVNFAYEAATVDLPETFRVVCHTDGLVEATNASGEPIGHERLHETLLDRETFATAQSVLGRIENTWTTHLAGAQPDDEALVLVIARG